MNLNLQILKSELDNYSWNYHLNSSNFSFKCGYPILFLDQTSFKEECVYISYSCNLPSNPSFTNHPSIICIGIPPQSYLNGDCDIIYTKTHYNSEILLNEVTRIFHKYYKWEFELNNIVENDLPLEHLANASTKFISNPFRLHDDHFKILFHKYPCFIKKYDYYYEGYIMETNTYFELNDINNLFLDDEYEFTLSAKEPYLYREKNLCFKILYYNIFIDDVYLARLMIDEIVEDIVDKDFSIIYILGNYIKKAILKKDKTNINKPNDFNMILKKLLDHSLVSEKKIIDVLYDMNWNVYDTYFCLIIKSSLNNKTSYSTKSISLHISSILYNDCYIIYDDNIVFVFNLNHSKLSYKEHLKIIKPILEENYLIAGISSTFNDFKNLYYYHYQSIIALKIGHKIHPHFSYFTFENYILNFFISNLKEKLIPKAIYPTGLIKLIEHDSLKNTDYVLLLKVFLTNNMNIAQTVKDTYIHRNTFLYRIERIKEILGMDLNNPNVRLLLLICFNIMDNS